MNSVINEDCYVAFLDILGFSDKVMTESPTIIENIFNTILDCKNEIRNDKCAWPNKDYDDLPENSIMYIMSDSIAIAIKSNIKGSLSFLIKWCKEIQTRLLFQHKILIRGGISRGLYYQNDEVSFGRGFVSAYKLENEAKTPRIIIDTFLVDDGLCDIKKDTDDNSYVDYFKDYLFDDNEFNWWKNYALDNIKRNKSVIEKFEWFLNKIENCHDMYLEQCNIEEMKKSGEFNSEHE